MRFIDRWEPEPRPLLLFAFVWGAVVSIAVTMLLQPYFSLVAGPASGLDYTTFAVTVQAPVVEEFAKSLGLLLLLLFARKHFDGPVDGVVFAFTIAAGNIMFMVKHVLRQVFIIQTISVGKEVCPIQPFGNWDNNSSQTK